MRYFTGDYERAIDSKNRVQLPAQFKPAFETNGNGEGLVVTLGEFRGTLSLFTQQAFEFVCDRLETGYMPEEEARRFELQWFRLSQFADLDKQGRFVLPERLRKKADLAAAVVLVGRGNRIDIWKPEALDRATGMTWDGDDWPNWPVFLRRRPTESI